MTEAIRGNSVDAIAVIEAAGSELNEEQRRLVKLCISVSGQSGFVQCLDQTIGMISSMGEAAEDALDEGEWDGPDPDAFFGTLHLIYEFMSSSLSDAIDEYNESVTKAFGDTPPIAEGDDA